MRTPPTYPFRSRREIHSGQPKVYSDAPNEDVTPTPSDPTPTPVRGTASPAHASHDASDARLSRQSTPAVSRVEADRRCLGDDRHALSADRQRTPRRPQA